MNYLIYKGVLANNTSTIEQTKSDKTLNKEKKKGKKDQNNNHSSHQTPVLILPFDKMSKQLVLTEHKTMMFTRNSI